MDPSLILPYLWVILVLVFLEGLLAADNACNGCYGKTFTT